jgi:hypothetical protein
LDERQRAKAVKAIAEFFWAESVIRYRRLDIPAIEHKVAPPRNCFV